MFGRIVRFLFALPVALAATAGLYYLGFVRFLDRDVDLSKAPMPVAEEPQKATFCLDCNAPPCVDCGGLLEEPETKFLYDPLCAFNCVDPIYISSQPDRTVAVPDDVFSVRSGTAIGKREAFVPPPRYPKACIDKGASGAVSVEFDITSDGAVANARIIQSADKCFNAEVLRYVSKFRYQPQIDESGRPTWRRGVRETFNFELAE